MPIYEYACPKCRVIFNFLSKRVNPDRTPACPKCGNRKMIKQMSRFAMTRGLQEPAAKPEAERDEPPMPDFDDPRVERAMMQLERDMEHLDENNPKHMAHMMRKMKDIMPPGTMPKELDVAIKGEGFFQIQLPDGRTAYSRDGSFERGPDGQLVTVDVENWDGESNNTEDAVFTFAGRRKESADLAEAAATAAE